MFLQKRGILYNRKNRLNNLVRVFKRLFLEINSDWNRRTGDINAGLKRFLRIVFICKDNYVDLVIRAIL